MNAKDDRSDQRLERWILFGSLAASVLSSLVQLLESVSKGGTSISEISGLLPYVATLMWFITIGSSLWILFARKRSIIDEEVIVHRYQDPTRDLAKMILSAGVTFLIVVALALGVHLLLKQGAEGKRIAELVIPEDRFGVVVAEFAEGPNFDQSQRGREISQLFASSLERSLRQANLSDAVVIRGWQVIRSDEAAEKIGAKLNADLVIWGWMPVGTEDALVANFNLLTPIYTMSTPLPQLFGTEVAGPDTIRLGRILARQTTILVACAIGLAYLDQGDSDLAVAQFSEAIVAARDDEKGVVKDDEFSQREFDKDLSVLYVFRGLAHDINGDVSLAQSDFQTAMEMDPLSSTPRIALGNTYYSREEWTEAEKLYSSAVDVSPGNAAVYYSLGNAYFSQNKVWEAASMYEKAVALRPSFALAYFGLGLSRESLNDCPGAIVAFSKVSDIAPNDPISVQAVRRAEQCHQGTASLTGAPDASPVPMPTLLPTVSPVSDFAPGRTPLLALIGSLMAAVAVVIGTWFYFQVFALRRHPMSGTITIYKLTPGMEPIQMGSLELPPVNRKKYPSRAFLPEFGIDEMFVECPTEAASARGEIMIRLKMRGEMIGPEKMSPGDVLDVRQQVRLAKDEELRHMGRWRRLH